MSAGASARATKRDPRPSTKLRWLPSLLVAVAILASQLASADSAAAQVATSGDVVPAAAEEPAAVEVVRLWGKDRYETSLAVARELVRLRGGRVETVVLASGYAVDGTQHHRRANAAYNAAIAASLAGRLDAPMLFVPPGGLGPEAMTLLHDSGVGTAFVIGSPLALPATNLLSAIRAGVKIKRVVGSAAAARLVGYPENEAAPVTAANDAAKAANAISEPVRAVVLGWSEVSAALAARAKLPLLDFPVEPLAVDGTAQFIRDHGVTHALLLGGASQFESPEALILDRLGVELVPIGGWDATSVAAFSLGGADGRLAPLAQRECPAGAPTTVGIASGHNIKRFSHWAERDSLWDAYSAAPLLGWLCSPLLLTDAHGLDVDANAVLYRAQLRGTGAVHVIGGAAAVRESVVEHAASPDMPVRAAIAVDHPKSDSVGQVIAVIDERLQMRRYLAGHRFSFIGKLSWSPQRHHIAFRGSHDGISGVFVLELATDDFWRVTPAKSSYLTDYDSTLDWSADGALLAMSVYPLLDINESSEDRDAKKEVLVADIRDKSVRWLTRNDERDIHGAWSPVGHRLVIFRAPATIDWTTGTAESVAIVDVATMQRRTLEHPGIVTDAKWSPNGKRLAIITYDNVMAFGYSSAGTVRIYDADELSTEPVTAAGHSGSIHEWSPDGCCIATLWGISGTRIRVVDASSGSFWYLTESSGTHRGGFRFRGWYPDSKRVVATYGWSDQGAGHYSTLLFSIDADTGRRVPLPYLIRRAKLRFGGFSPDGTRAVYGATDLYENIHRIVTFEPAPTGDAEVALDATALLDLLADYPDQPYPDDYVEPRVWFDWPQLSWNEYGIAAVAVQGW